MRGLVGRSSLAQEGLSLDSGRTKTRCQTPWRVCTAAKAGIAMPTAERGKATFPEVRDDQREPARKRLEAKRKLRIGVASYLIVNVFLVLVWAISGRGYFWPGWVMARWGVLLLLDACKLYCVSRSQKPTLMRSCAGIPNAPGDETDR